MAEKRTITKKAISVKKTEVSVEENVKTTEVKSSQRRECYFCQAKKNPTFLDMATLKRHVSDRGKIVSRIRSGACSKHQRQITKGVKYARHLSLLPFTPKV